MSLENSPTKQGFRTYIGLRYVPKIIGVWDNTKEYEALSIVVYEGNSYTSKMIVPIGVDIHNEQYWVMTGNYNAQVANLSNQVEVAVRQILDYATDFEKFKTDMMKLYNDFTVDADGKIEDKLEEVEQTLTSRYEAFQSFVTRALEEYRSEMDTFTADTQAKYTAFMDNANNTIAEGLASISSGVYNRQIDFENRLNQNYASLETELNNLVVESGNPEATSAEITTARGSYPTLAARLNGMENLAPFTHKVTAPTSGELDLNTYTTVGIYVNNSGGVTLLNSPFPSPAEFMLFVMNNSASVVQLLFATNFGNNGFMESMYMRTKFRTGIWSNWFTVAQGNNNVRIVRNTEATGTFDFNSATTHACVMYTADNIQGYINGPTTLVEPTDFMLHTIQVSNGNEYIGTTIQICIFGVENEMWLRQKVVDVWTGWTKLSADSDVSSLRQEFETFKTATTSILGEVKPQVDVNTTAIANLNTRLQTAEGDVADLKNNVNSVTANVNSLYGDVGTLQTNVNNLTGSVGTLQGDVQTLNTTVASKVNNYEVVSMASAVDLTALGNDDYLRTDTVYTLRLDSNTLYSGQPRGEEVKMFVYALGVNQRSQVFISETGKIYKRNYNNASWGDIEEVSKGGVNTIVVHADTDFFVQMANKKTSIKFEKNATTGEYKPTGLYNYNMVNKLADITFTRPNNYLRFIACDVKCDGRDIDLTANQTVSGQVIGFLYRCASVSGDVEHSTHFVFKNNLEFERCSAPSYDASGVLSASGSTWFSFDFNTSVEGFVFDGINYTSIQNLPSHEIRRPNSIIVNFTNNENYSIAIKPSITVWQTNTTVLNNGYVTLYRGNTQQVILPQVDELNYFSSNISPANTGLFVIDIV